LKPANCFDWKTVVLVIDYLTGEAGGISEGDISDGDISDGDEDF
jgi:hypothetical protein